MLFHDRQILTTPWPENPAVRWALATDPTGRTWVLGECACGDAFSRVCYQVGRETRWVGYFAAQHARCRELL
jgi:hypothetical protein